jgi:hypothetical protein
MILSLGNRGMDSPPLLLVRPPCDALRYALGFPAVTNGMCDVGLQSLSKKDVLVALL